jgi:glycosyltransferase involved in cell wall biosynthesis
MCNFEYPPLGGGGGIAMAMLAKSLATRHDITVLTSGTDGATRTTEEDGVRVVRVPVLGRRRSSNASLVSLAAYLPAAAYRGAGLLRSEKYDVVNSHFVLPTGVVGALLARRARVPHVISVHGGDLYDPSKWLSPHAHATLRHAVRRLLRGSRLVIGQSTNTLENLSRFYPTTTPAIRIPLGIPDRPVPRPDRKRWGIGDDALLLVTVCRLVKRKGLEQLIQLMQRIEDLDCHLLVVGNGPQESALRELSQRLGVAERVKFVGWVSDEDKFCALASADAFVSTSQHEGFGLMYLEAMCCAIPVVTYDNGGQTDFLRDGETGGLVPVNDLAAFETSLRKLLADPERRRRIGEANRHKFEGLTIEQCALRYEDAFAGVLSRTIPAGAAISHS